MARPCEDRAGSRWARSEIAGGRKDGAVRSRRRNGWRSRWHSVPGTGVAAADVTGVPEETGMVGRRARLCAFLWRGGDLREVRWWGVCEAQGAREA